MEVKTLRPFSNGTEFEMWEDKNCNRCSKSYASDSETACDLDEALTISYLGDGRINESQAERLGIVDGVHHGCTERVPVSS